MLYEKCYYCHLPATHTNSIPDRNKQGYNLNECGYKTIYICVAHAIEARRDNCHRVEELEEENWYKGAQ